MVIKVRGFLTEENVVFLSIINIFSDPKILKLKFEHFLYILNMFLLCSQKNIKFINQVQNPRI